MVLDNNLCERALKKVILHRKNALFYRTENGARVGDLLMSLIYTCQLNDANPFDYLTELQRHDDQVRGQPRGVDVPWNSAREALTNESGKRSRTGNACGAEAMSQRKPKKAAPATRRPESMAQLRRALSGRKKAELVDTLLELAQADRGVLRRFTARESLQALRTHAQAAAGR